MTVRPVKEDPVTILQPVEPSMLANLRACWRYRKLLFYFSQRMTRMRYKGTILGWLWLFIRPIVVALCFTMVFGNLAKMPSDGLPYIVFFFSGMMVWLLFSNGLMFTTRSLYANRSLITKLYFPKIIVPIASLTPNILDFAIFVGAFALLLGYFWLYHDVFYLQIGSGLLLSLFLLFMTMVFVVGLGLWTSVLNSHAKDVKFTLPYLLQMWFFVSPVIYPLSLIPDQWLWTVHLNPMAVTIEGFRYGLLGTGGVSLTEIAVASFQILLVVWSGLWFFGKAEAKMVDAL